MTLEAGGELLGVQGTCVSNLYIVCQQSKQFSICSVGCRGNVHFRVVLLYSRSLSFEDKNHFHNIW